jgi:hypothetical protein
VTEFVREPASQRSVWVAVDADGNESGWEVVQIGNVTYMSFSSAGEDPQWMSMSSDEADVPTQDLNMYSAGSADSYLGSAHCENRGRDDVEGHRAVRWVCSQEVFGSTFAWWLDGGRFTDGGMEFWISEQYDVQIGSLTWWEGVDGEGNDVSWYMEEKVWAINEPFTIEAPAGVELPGLPDDVPLMPNARVTTAMAGMVVIEIEAPIDEVLDFYREEMAEYGWDLDGEYGESLNFSKGARTLMAMFTTQGAKVSGVFMVSE